MTHLTELSRNWRNSMKSSDTWQEIDQDTLLRLLDVLDATASYLEAKQQMETSYETLVGMFSIPTNSRCPRCGAGNDQNGPLDSTEKVLCSCCGRPSLDR